MRFKGVAGLIEGRLHGRHIAQGIEQAEVVDHAVVPDIGDGNAGLLQ